MPSLKVIGIFEDSHDDEDVFDAEADFHNLDSTFQVSPIPTIRIHKDHPLEQVNGYLHSAPQTRRMPKNLKEHGLVEEEVYVCQPPRFEEPDFLDKVYKVEKALYGLHQALRACLRVLNIQDEGEVVNISRAVAYTDSDYAGASLDRKSTTRGCQFLGCRQILWQCKKQTVVANSTSEAEYVAASSCRGQYCYAKKLQEELEKEHEEAYKQIDWNAAFDHVQAKETQYIKRYHGFKKKPQSESEARKNMISYLKNTEGFKMEFFKGKTYDQILLIFQARFNANLKFLFKTREEIEKEDEEIIKSINETPAQKAAKRRKLSEEAQEADNLKRRLEIVQDEDDDVFVEAIPLAQKVPVVYYQIVVIDNKPRYKIIRADDTHQLYISFTTLLKNFDREDLETLWRIVKDRFSTKKPTNFSDKYLLLTLKTMFGELDKQDLIWRNQKSVHGLALVKRWKLLTSCGVHVIILSTVQLFLLVERRYPLSRFTLEQLVNVARLQVEEESEMSLELLRFTRHQLLEYQQR
uniref:Putative ribonuclease H-like domain-containing protein n=1 Tax=Tanacetum cinerariifolium TaxID=118510 RepID=A0A699I9A9_TANCI|nr:putative ribonuclease H-like domain-containing protein [Tanacetum cinerariifolium]